MFCPKCNQEIPEEFKFCPNCGKAVVSEDLVLDKDFESTVQNEGLYFDTKGAGIPEPEKDKGLITLYKEIIGPEKVDYYLPKFIKYKKNGDQFDWNTPAAFFGATWLMYRKAYLAALMLVVFENVLLAIFPIGILGLFLIRGVFGSFIYFKHAERIIEKAGMQHDNDSRIMYAKKCGGTNIFAAILFAAINFFITLLLCATLLGIFLIPFLPLL